ncbi:helix-turn-helix domain-containing protein [Flavobacterium sp. Fl-318]|uniref:Helix-turn-helix domain-containing protein n=1 Tax=Flavobacterium cupriresistens TaxID=2893885 RepID=A0ABU4REJ1_9FLAO|nr:MULTISPECIES: helix-turn-helix domain-containing protein [unclassified Flavobacterium]MDX6191016.1 helix-turn-helix domain-containing protein [Flavobacterium sp. Fl-318]UFH43812.1 helix-turn-helix domain-containing protein [Flavobacterium sp. F-323]
MRLIISFLLLFVLNITFALQKKELSEQEYLLLQDKIRISGNTDRDLAITYAYEMLKSNNDKHLAFANGALAYLFQLKSETVKSKEKYVLAFNYLNKMPDSRDKTQLKSYLYNYGGLIEWKRGNFGEALENYQTGIKLSIQLGDIIQIIKFKSNIAIINEEVGNYQLAIKNLRYLNDFIDKNESYYSKEQYNIIKSNNNLHLAGSYEGWYMKNRTKLFLLDSAAYFYKKTVSFSHDFPINNIGAKISLGNVYYMKNDFKNAEKAYYDIIFFAKQNNYKSEFKVANYNLGNLYYEVKKYDKALVFFKKVDSVSLIDNSKDESFLKSNYYQAKIYNIFKEPELAFKYSKNYLDNYEKTEAKLNNEALEVNYKLGVGDLSEEMVTIQKKYEFEVFFNKALKVFYVLLVVGIVFLLIKNIRDKNKAHKKMNALIEEFKANLEKKENSETETVLIDQEEDPLIKKENVNLSIDEDKENKIVEKLLALENKLEYLNADFTLSYVAKKIKTNTTYLSYIVNKRFGKSFGEYSNELKINYVINQMITNHMYRKYSTQAIAESVGFKNAVSFAKSFRKRTGVSPAQFANNI